jgi:hypothetical protein
VENEHVLRSRKDLVTGYWEVDTGSHVTTDFCQGCGKRWEEKQEIVELENAWCNDCLHSMGMVGRDE